VTKGIYMLNFVDILRYNDIELIESDRTKKHLRTWGGPLVMTNRLSDHGKSPFLLGNRLPWALGPWLPTRGSVMPPSTRGELLWATTWVLNLHISSLNPDPKSRQSSVQNLASWLLGDYILTISGITIQRAIPVTSCRMEPKRSKGDISRSKRHSRPGILGEAANHQFTWTTHCYWLIISLVLADYWPSIGLWLAYEKEFWLRISIDLVIWLMIEA
jgi:hypothetical protein